MYFPTYPQSYPQFPVWRFTLDLLEAVFSVVQKFAGAISPVLLFFVLLYGIKYLQKFNEENYFGRCAFGFMAAFRTGTVYAEKY